MRKMSKEIKSLKEYSSETRAVLHTSIRRRSR